MDDLDMLAGILAKTGDLVAGTPREKWDASTPCPGFDVHTLLAHICGWVRVFAAGAIGERFAGDLTTYEVHDGSAEEFRDAAARIVEGWRQHGVDRTVPLVGGDMPGQMVQNMTFMEYLTHGWDLATATGQPVPFTEDEAAETLRRAQETLQPQFRGDQIGPAVDVPADAPAIDRLVGFMGRTPS